MENMPEGARPARRGGTTAAPPPPRRTGEEEGANSDSSTSTGAEDTAGAAAAAAAEGRSVSSTTPSVLLQTVRAWAATSAKEGKPQLARGAHAVGTRPICSSRFRAAQDEFRKDRPE